MSKKLVIVESPAKAKTINKILGDGFKVTSCLGHVRDLPVSNLGVDIEKGFRPKYVTSKGKEKVIGELKKAAAAASEIYLAPDPDREGEAIAWHIQELLKPGCPDKAFLRVQYNEITPQAVRLAFEHPGELNMQRVDAQQARRILDRIVGYKCSPLLWKRIRRGLSAGRVQSVALRLLCERELEIRNFVPVPYWIIGARARKQVAPLDPFLLRLLRIDDEKADVSSEDKAVAVMKDLEGRRLEVVDIARKQVSKRAAPPFITSTLQQAGSTHCGFSPSRTMAIAQQLYEGVDLGDGPAGLITYMRTDSVSVSADAMQACRAFVAEAYGSDYVPEKANVYRSRQGAQEAHECVRPTDVRRTPDSLEGRLDAPQMRLYRLIWQRFVASQMAPAQLEVRTARADALPLPGQTTRYAFQASASDIIFPGYMKVAGMQEPKGEDEENEAEFLPKLEIGEQLDVVDWLNDRKETKPPPRFSQASLIRELESNGVGRPSTYASIIETLQERRYAKTEKRMLFPTELGLQVSALLVSLMGELFNVQFTASMEEKLDEIEAGSVAWQDMLSRFYEQFEVWLAKGQPPPADAGKAALALGLMEAVAEWGPEVKRGKRTYSDRSFFESLREQVQGGKALSERQLESLMKLACRYREQIPTLEPVMKELGREDLLAAGPEQPPSEASRRKLALLGALTLDDRAKKFLDSLSQRVEGGRSLSPAQGAALDKILMAHASEIENFDAISPELEIGVTAPVEQDNESPLLLDGMGAVSQWQEPVKRGKRTFDDREFYTSLKRQFDVKKYLTPRQKYALKKMVYRYRAQIPGFDELREMTGIKGGKDSAAE